MFKSNILLRRTSSALLFILLFGSVYVAKGQSSTLEINNFRLELLGANGYAFDVMKSKSGGYEIFFVHSDGTNRVYGHHDFSKLGSIKMDPCDNITNVGIRLTHRSDMFLPNNGLSYASCEDFITAYASGALQFVSEFEYIDSSYSLLGFEPYDEPFVVSYGASESFRGFMDELKNDLSLTLLNINAYNAEVGKFAESITVSDSDDGKHQVKVNVYYDESFFSDLLMEPERISLKLVMLHEIGHIILNHGSGKKSELDADEFAGEWSRRYYNTERDQVEAAYRTLLDTYTPNNNYPSTEERIEKVLAGWDKEEAKIASRQAQNEKELHEKLDKLELLALDYPDSAATILTEIENQSLPLSVNIRLNWNLSEIYRNEFINRFDSANAAIYYPLFQDAVFRMKRYDHLLSASGESDWRINYWRGRLKYIYNNGQSTEAQADFLTALSSEGVSDETKAELYFYLGSQALRDDDYQTATNYFNQSINLDPTHSYSYFRRAEAKHKGGNREWSSLIADVKKAIDLEMIQTTHSVRINRFERKYTKWIEDALMSTYSSSNYQEYIDIYTNHASHLQQFNEDQMKKVAIAFSRTDSHEDALELFTQLDYYPEEYFATLTESNNQEKVFDLLDWANLDAELFNRAGLFVLSSSIPDKNCKAFTEMLEGYSSKNFFGEGAFLQAMRNKINEPVGWLGNEIKSYSELVEWLNQENKLATIRERLCSSN